MAKGNWITYSEDERAFIKANCTLPRKELTEKFNQTFGRDISRGNIEALCTRNKWLTGRSGRFSEGHTPWNKGVHFKVGGSNPKTRFKPGRKPHTWRPVGTEKIDGDGYLLRKVRDDAPLGMAKKNWKPVHVIIWEEHNGAVPEGHIVRFRDGDRTNLDIGNLVLITRKENAIINKSFNFKGLPPEGFDVIVALAQLKLLASKKKRELENA